MAKGLGKGINALFNQVDLSEETVEEIKIADLRPNPYQPRKHFDDEALAELKESVLQHGILQPLIVRKSLKGYDIVAGERRFRAAKLAGLDTVPAIVRELSEALMREIALLENLQREDLSPLEEAQAYDSLLKHLDRSHTRAACQTSWEKQTAYCESFKTADTARKYSTAYCRRHAFYGTWTHASWLKKQK